MVPHPAFGVPVSVRATQLSENSDDATAQTIDRMRELSRADARSRSIRDLATRLGAGSLPPREYARAAYQFVRENVRFVQDWTLAAPLGMEDPGSAEVLVRPRELLRMGTPQGDCDDFSMLTAALLLADNVDASFATVAADSDSPARYSHVYVVARLADGDMALDSSHGPFAGWEVPNQFGKLREWGLSGMSGLGIGVGQEVAPSTGINWGGILSDLIKSGTAIGQQVLQKPVYQTNAQGTTIYGGPAPTVAPPGSVMGAQILPGVDNSTLLLGGLALVVVLMVAKK